MKTLLLIRHAKSSWDDIALPDKDRPLDDRGKRDATKMGTQVCELWFSILGACRMKDSGKREVARQGRRQPLSIRT